VEALLVLQRKIKILVESLGAQMPSEEQLRALLSYTELLQQWSAKVDLVSPAPLEVQLERHIVDSVAASLLLARACEHLSDDALIDLGSGGGLPGIPCAILEPERRVYLVEPRDKRSVFLKETRRLLELKNVEVVRKEGQALQTGDVAGAKIAITRALAISDELFANIKNIMPSGACFALMVTRTETISGPWFMQLKHQEYEYVLPDSGAKRALVLCFT
jgi:16S rRNA (guanine527-N7)-methyltransferase